MAVAMGLTTAVVVLALSVMDRGSVSSITTPLQRTALPTPARSVVSAEPYAHEDVALTATPDQRPIVETDDGVVVLDFLLGGDCLLKASYSLTLARRVDGRRVGTPRTHPLQPGVVLTVDSLQVGEYSYDVTMHEALLFQGYVELDRGATSVAFDCADLPGLLVTVTDRSGAPIPDAQVALEAWHVRPFALLEVTTAPDGTALFAPLPPHGEYFVEADSDHASSRRAGPFLVLAESPRRSVHVALCPSRPLRGRVLDPNGEPIAGARVTRGVRRSEVGLLTDPDGGFEFADAPLDPVRLRVEADGFPRLVVDVDAGTRPAQELVLALAEPDYVRGVVITDGPPHERVRLHAAPLDISQGEPLAQEYPLDVRSDGTFVLGPLPAGRVELTDLHDPSFSRVVATGQPVEITLASWRRNAVDLRLVGPGGGPVVGEVAALVSIGDDAAHVPPARRTDEAGRLRIAWRAVDSIADIHLATPGYEPVVLSGVDALAGGVRTVRLHPAVETSLTVASSDGHAQDDATVLLRWVDDAARFRPGAYAHAHSVRLAAETLWEQRLQADAEGRVRVAAGRESLEYLVSAPGHFPERGALRSGQAGLDVVLTPLRPPLRR